MPRCSRCGRGRETARVQRFGGGNFRRAGRFYDTSICGECARTLLDYANPGQRLVSQYSVSGLKLALQRLEAHHAD